MEQWQHTKLMERRTNHNKNKGDRAECGNSRGISLLSSAGKVLARILLKRLISTISENLLPETLCGFRTNWSTVEMVFSLRQLMEKSS